MGLQTFDLIAMHKVSLLPTASDQALWAQQQVIILFIPTLLKTVLSRESEPSHDEGDDTWEDDNAEEDKGGIETSSDGQVASDGKEGQECPHTQDTLTGISQVFSGHEDTDPELDPREKIQSIWQKQHPKSPKEDSPHKKSSKSSSSEEELPMDETLHDEARQKAW